jgi:magnesium-protoporphyrin O-methyltransferase
MASCCPSRDYRRFFNQRFARRLANRYRKRGLDPTAQTMVQFLQELGIEDASILEIGGGVGEIQIELLKLGAARAQNLELSPAYEQQARTLAGQAGVQGRPGLAHPRPRPGSRGGGASRPSDPAPGGVLLSGL